MTILNNIRYGLAITTLTLAYLTVAVSGLLLEITDLITQSEISHTDWKRWVEMYKTELDVIKVGLL